MCLCLAHMRICAYVYVHVRALYVLFMDVGRSAFCISKLPYLSLSLLLELSSSSYVLSLSLLF